MRAKVDSEALLGSALTLEITDVNGAKLTELVPTTHQARPLHPTFVAPVSAQKKLDNLKTLCAPCPPTLGGATQKA